MNWNGLVKLSNAVRSENWKPTVLAINETQLHQLLSDDKFIHAQYLPSDQTDIQAGSIGNVLGMRVQASTLVPNGTGKKNSPQIWNTRDFRGDIPFPHSKWLHREKRAETPRPLRDNGERRQIPGGSLK